jgi:uncharacterized protein
VKPVSENGLNVDRNNTVAPLRPKDRAVAIDFLRGCAVLAMILWNFNSTSMGNYYHGGHINHFVSAAISIIDIENTAHLVFSFLFGWGLAIHVCSRKPFMAVYLRRLTALFILGAIHSILWYRPDFIHIYAVFGIVFLVFMNRSNNAILISALFLMGLPYISMSILTRFISTEALYGIGTFHSLSEQVIMHSNYSETVIMRIYEFSRECAHPALYLQNMDIFAAFLLGFYAFRRGVFQNISKHIGLIKKVLYYSLALHLLGMAWLFLPKDLSTMENSRPNWMLALNYILSLSGRPYGTKMMVQSYSIQALSLFYVCVIVLIVQHNVLKKFFHGITSVGEIALSNYLLHSLIGTTLFYGYAFGLFRELGSTIGMLLAMLVFLIQMILSGWWLSHFRFGPIEWLLRCFAYFKFLPMRERRI